MAAETIQVDLGYTAPDFKLLDTISGELKSLDELKGQKATVVMFICNHCPYVLHVEEELRRLGRDFQEKGLGVLAISSNDVEQYPADSPEEMAKKDYSFPYLYDETQEVAKLFDAACTPDIFLYNAEGKLTYRGQLDGSRPGNDIPVTGSDLRKAVDCMLSGREIDFEQVPSLGCNIKWKN